MKNVDWVKNNGIEPNSIHAYYENGYYKIVYPTTDDECPVGFLDEIVEKDMHEDSRHAVSRWLAEEHE